MDSVKTRRKYRKEEEDEATGEEETTAEDVASRAVERSSSRRRRHASTRTHVRPGPKPLMTSGVKAFLSTTTARLVLRATARPKVAAKAQRMRMSQTGCRCRI